MVAAGCQAPLCFPSVGPSGRYQADVVERYDEQSQFRYTNEIGVKPGGTSGTCTGPDGVGPGASLVFTGTGTFDRPHSCSGITADLTLPPAEITIIGPATNGGVQADMAAYGTLVFTRNVSFGQCTGTLGLAVLPGAGSKPDDIFLAPTPGGYPHAVLFKMFAPLNPSDTACPSCYDDFVIALSKL
jgi:hypothetical protein